MMRDQHRLVARDKGTLQWRLLMLLPRNLIYVFVLLIVAAFAGMVYVVYYSDDYSYLAELNKTEVIVHPLFKSFIEGMKDINSVPEMKLSEIDLKFFYEHHLSHSQPLYVSNGAMKFPAFDKWRNNTYLKEVFAHHSLEMWKLTTVN